MTDETSTQKFEKVRDVLLQSGNFKPTGQNNNRWEVILLPDETYDDMMRPRFFANVGPQLSIGDILEVRTQDGTHYGEFYVTYCSRLEAKIQKIHWMKLGGADASNDADEEYAYAWKGPAWKHCVIRVVDNEIMVKELLTKEEAERWIIDRKLAA